MLEHQYASGERNFRLIDTVIDGVRP